MKDRKSKKEIKKVIKKYLKNKDQKNLLLFGGTSGIYAGFFLAADITFTAGTITPLMILGSSLAGLGSADSILKLIKGSKTKKGLTNTAQQTLETSPYVALTLEKMEERLKKAFNTVAEKEPYSEERAIFLHTAKDVKKDLQKLSPAFKIVSGGPYKFNKKEYEFIIGERVIGTGKKELLTLQQVLEEMSPTSSKPSIPKNNKPNGGFGL